MYRRVLFSLIAMLLLVSAFSAVPALASEASLCTVKANDPNGNEASDKTCIGAGGTVVENVQGKNVGNAELNGTLKVKCSTSTTESKVSQNLDSEVVLKNDKVKFENCGSCTVNISAGGETSIPEPVDSPLGGTIEQQKGKVLVKGVKGVIECLGEKCKVESAAAGDEGKLDKHGTSPGELSFIEAPTVISGGTFCGTSGKETVNYLNRTLTGGNEIWFASDGLKL
jgi:hypothetical protein